MPDITTVPSSEIIENWLKNRDIKFSEPKLLKMTDVDEKQSQRNQARAEAIEKPVAERYVSGMKNGDLFPPIVVYKRGDRYIIVDGNHRYTSSKKVRAKEIWAYVIDSSTTTSEMIELLTAEANTKHGQPTSNEWRSRQAVYLTNLGHSVGDVAVALSMTESSVRQAIRENNGAERAHKLGLKDWEKLPYTMRVRVSDISSDPLFISVFNVAIETQWSMGAEFNRFVTKINATRSETEAMELIKETYEQRLFDLKQAEGKGKARSRISNPKMQVLSALGMVLAMEPDRLNRLFLTEEERAEVARRLGDASLRLMECEEALRG